MSAKQHGGKITGRYRNRVEGFPLDSLSIDIASGKYYYDLEVKDVSTSVDDEIRKFFSEILQGKDGHINV